MPGKPVMKDGSTMDFSHMKYTHISPMARNLFGIDGITRVFYGKDFISVTKEELVQWEVLKPEILGVITDQYTKGLPLFTEELPPEDTAIHSDDTEAIQMIKEIIETRIRPFVQEDGGDITYLNFDEEEGLVTIEMKGSCAGCPSSAVTLKSGIESMLKHYV
jgi:Fe-S cluster biogenesis protein NfuA